jgi:putative membrane protein
MVAVREADRRALGEAIAAIEAVSSVEVVVTVRTQSGTYLHGDLLGGLLASVAALVFVLYAPWDFSTELLLIAPLALGGLGGLLVSRWPRARRALSPARLRARQVTTSAHATFHEKEVGLTRRRTGLLVYVSLLERELRLLPDRAIVDALAPELWQARLAAMTAAAARSDLRALAAALAALAPALAACLPRSADDVNELPDGVDVV